MYHEYNQNDSRFWNHVKANDSKWSKADYMVCQNKNLSNRSI